MADKTPTPKEYIRKEKPVPALQWDGTLESVPTVTQWILQYDPSAIVTANFSADGMYLRVQTSGLVLGVSSSDYITVLNGIVVSFGEESFLKQYEEASTDV